jgi:hypothetical protein
MTGPVLRDPLLVGASAQHAEDNTTISTGKRSFGARVSRSSLVSLKSEGDVRSHFPARKLLNSSRVNPASRSNDISVPFGTSRLCDCAKVPRAATGNGIVENAVAARGVIQLAVGFELGGSPSQYKNGWQIRHASRSQ